MLVVNWKSVNLREMQKYFRQSHTKGKKGPISLEKKGKAIENKLKLCHYPPPLLLCSGWRGQSHCESVTCKTCHGGRMVYSVRMPARDTIFKGFSPSWAKRSVCVPRSQILISTQHVQPLGMNQATAEPPPPCHQCH